MLGCGFLHTLAYINIKWDRHSSLAVPSDALELAPTISSARQSIYSAPTVSLTGPLSIKMPAAHIAPTRCVSTVHLVSLVLSECHPVLYMHVHTKWSLVIKLHPSTDRPISYQIVHCLS